MILAVIDIFYIVMIALIFCSIGLMEVQIKEIKTMMKEHIKFDDKMWDKEKARIKTEHIKKYPKNPLVK